MAILAILAISLFWSPKTPDFHFWHIGPWIRGMHAVSPYGTNTPLFSGLRYTVRYNGTLTPIWDLQMGPGTPKMTHFGPILDPFWTLFWTPFRPLFGTLGRYGPSQGAATRASPGAPDTMGLRVSGTDPKRVDSGVFGCPDPQKRLFWTFGWPEMQNPPIFLNGFKRRLLDFAKGLILHHFRDPHFGVSRGPNQPSAGFVVSGHVNLCLFLLSPPGRVSPDPSEWVLVSHAVEIPDPQKGSRTSPKGVNSRGAHFTFCANLFLFTWFWEY